MAFQPLSRRIVTLPQNFPMIVCLCGSSKFKEEFDYAAKVFNYHGWIVLTMAYFTHHEKKVGDSNVDRFSAIQPKLDELHKRKIDLADVVHIINVGGYIGESTQSEMKYALECGKPVSMWNQSDINYMNLRLR
jgi:hypothetical protein